VVDGKWTATLSSAELKGLGGGSTPLVVEATLTDRAGNVSPAQTREFYYSTDEVAQPSFTSVTGITPSSGDAAFNLADFTLLSASNRFAVRGTATASTTRT